MEVKLCFLQTVTVICLIGCVFGVKSAEKPESFETDSRFMITGPCMKGYVKIRGTCRPDLSARNLGLKTLVCPSGYQRAGSGCSRIDKHPTYRPFEGRFLLLIYGLLNFSMNLFETIE